MARNQYGLARQSFVLGMGGRAGRAARLLVPGARGEAGVGPSSSRWVQRQPPIRHEGTWRPWHGPRASRALDELFEGWGPTDPTGSTPMPTPTVNISCRGAWPLPIGAAPHRWEAGTWRIAEGQNAGRPVGWAAAISKTSHRICGGSARSRMSRRSVWGSTSATPIQ